MKYPILIGPQPARLKDRLKTNKNLIDFLGDSRPFGAQYVFPQTNFFSDKYIFKTISFQGRFNNMLNNPFDNYINYNLNLKAVCFQMKMSRAPFSFLNI